MIDRRGPRGPGWRLSRRLKTKTEIEPGASPVIAPPPSASMRRRELEQLVGIDVRDFR
jgi:hypothetical protein